MTALKGPSPFASRESRNPAVTIMRDRAVVIQGGLEMPRAYVLVETAPGKAGTVRDQAGHGLMNCKGLAHSFRPSEVVVHLDATDLDALEQAIMRSIPRLDGVLRVTTCAVFTT